MKVFLRKVLMDKEITDLTADKTVYFSHANSAKPPYVEYMITNEYGSAYAENKETATNYTVQIDVFSSGDYGALEDVIKSKMIDANFDRSMSADLYEEQTGLYHKAMRFIYTSEQKIEIE